MYIAADSLDDLLHKTYRHILVRGTPIKPTKGPAREVTGILLKLSDPRSRLSRTESRGIVFSCLGELIWILSGSDKLEPIKYYLPKYTDFSEDQETVYGAYGPRLFGNSPNDQVHRIEKLLRRNGHSRQAVIQIFGREDLLEPHLDVPCTCTLQFLIRKNRLHLFTSMRSNDAWKGLPHDVFTFTMIQELVARSLGVQLGTYKHAVGSLHIYDEDLHAATKYLDEGWQPRRPMSPMPPGNPWSQVAHLISYEQSLRSGAGETNPHQFMEPYWANLATLLAIYKVSKTPHTRQDLMALRRWLSDDAFVIYYAKRCRLVSAQRRQLHMFHD